MLERYHQQAIEQGEIKGEALEKLLSFRPRIEKLVIKDVKLRTFITDDQHRDDMVAHVYDTTYEVIRKRTDTVVVIDDSIVRGTTLEKSILKCSTALSLKKSWWCLQHRKSAIPTATALICRASKILWPSARQ
ncbi:MAG: hypothetical protein HC927_05175 [Deltaproteobacteria bacterium]|nr:hypothetical protein [Deltaproteobacteria bacterium]